MKIELLYFDGCPHWKTADERVTAVARELGVAVEYRSVETEQDAEALSFRGSPTILVDGRDPFAAGTEPTGLSCRIYRTPQGPAGAPTLQQIREGLGL